MKLDATSVILLVGLTVQVIAIFRGYSWMKERMEKLIDMRIANHPIIQEHALDSYKLSEVLATSRTSKTSIEEIRVTLARMEGYKNE
jgi:hypothetical protein